jgi:DNA-binding response OmpR family regulator
MRTVVYVFIAAMNVLLVEDELNRSFMDKGLKAEGFVVDVLDNGEDAYQ